MGFRLKLQNSRASSASPSSWLDLSFIHDLAFPLVCYLQTLHIGFQLFNSRFMALLGSALGCLTYLAFFLQPGLLEFSSRNFSLQRQLRSSANSAEFLLQLDYQILVALLGRAWYLDVEIDEGHGWSLANQTIHVGVKCISFLLVA